VSTENPDPKPSTVTPEEGSTADSPDSQLAAMTAERDKLAVEKAEAEDRLRRAWAEFENARKRAERDRSEFVQFAAMDVLKAMLPILDDFERALKTETADKEYAKGVELIYNRFYEALKRQGLEPIETKGKKFDPNIHEAVQREQTEDADDQAILDEYQRGYHFKGKLLRPAWVKVAVHP
jgi:molecular chaperone GrpE